MPKYKFKNRTSKETLSKVQANKVTWRVWKVTGRHFAVLCVVAVAVCSNTTEFQTHKKNC